MRAWTVEYVGLADKPSRTITGTVVVTAEVMETAAARAVRKIRQHEGRGSSVAKVLSIRLHIKRGGTVDRDTAKRLEAAPAASRATSMEGGNA